MSKKAPVLCFQMNVNCIDDGSGHPLLVTEKAVLYPVSDTLIQVILFKDGEEVGEKVSYKEAAALLKKMKQPSLSSQREIAIQHKLILDVQA